MNITRENFIVRAASCAAGLFVLPRMAIASRPIQNPEKGPPLDPALVKEFVGAAHKDLAKVKSMLEARHDLLNAVNNLGGWDWEDAVGAAGHVGLPETANYLLDKGARLTICVAAMLGKIDIVRAAVSAFPYMKDAVGPHKISLLRHAFAGGENSREVAEYLKSIGAKEK